MNPYYGPSTFATPASLLEPSHHMMHPHLAPSMRRIHGGQALGHAGNPHLQGPLGDGLFANLGRPLYDSGSSPAVNNSSSDSYSGLDLPMARDYTAAESMGTPGLHLPVKDYSSPSPGSLLLQPLQRSRRPLDDPEDGVDVVDEGLESPLGVMGSRYNHHMMRSPGMHPLMQSQHLTSSHHHHHLHSQIIDEGYEVSHRGLGGCGSNPAPSNGSMKSGTPCSTPSNSMTSNFIHHHPQHHHHHHQQQQQQQQQHSPQSGIWNQSHMMAGSVSHRSHHPTLTPICQQLNSSPRLDARSPPPLLHQQQQQQQQQQQHQQQQSQQQQQQQHQQLQQQKASSKSDDSRQYNSSPSSNGGSSVPFYPWMSVVGEWHIHSFSNVCFPSPGRPRPPPVIPSNLPVISRYPPYPALPTLELEYVRSGWLAHERLGNSFIMAHSRICDYAVVQELKEGCFFLRIFEDFWGEELLFCLIGTCILEMFVWEFITNASSMSLSSFDRYDVVGL